MEERGGRREVEERGGREVEEGSGGRGGSDVEE